MKDGLTVADLLSDNDEKYPLWIRPTHSSNYTIKVTHFISVIDGLSESSNYFDLDSKTQKNGFFICDLYSSDISKHISSDVKISTHDLPNWETASSNGMTVISDDFFYDDGKSVVDVGLGESLVPSDFWDDVPEKTKDDTLSCDEYDEFNQDFSG